MSTSTARALRPREGAILDAIRLELGRDPGLVLWRNTVVHAEQWDPKTGGAKHVHGGLPVGSADLVGVLAPGGRFLALEVKRPGERARPEQEAWLALVRTRGGFAAVVDSVDAARAAVARARAGALA